jgi:L-asparaginase II
VSLEGEQLALAAASHAGTAEHQRVAAAMLASASLAEDDLLCPPDWPSDPDAAALARTTGARRRLAMNCSGKHAAFLLSCARNGWSTDDYLDPLHPLQQLVMATVEEFTGSRVGHVGTDGCGAPLFGMSLTALATGISRLAQGRDQHCASLVAAMTEHAWALDGPGRSNTVVVEELGLVAKLGAEGVNVMAADDGTTVAVKVLDGNGRATTMIALRLLVDAGVVDEQAAQAVIERTSEPVLGAGVPVGGFRPAF